MSAATTEITDAILRMSQGSWLDVRFALFRIGHTPRARVSPPTTEYNALVLIHLSRSADVSATIGRDHVIDLVGGNGHPHTVHFNFVVVANHATLGWPTIHQIAARALAIISLEFRVEPLMPFIVPYSVVSFLRRRACTKRHGDRAAEKDNEFAFQSINLVETQ
jgi:hypothetical protein